MFWSRSPERAREEGAIAPMVAIVATVLILFAAFAVDLGLARVARQDMQSLADAVALDMVRKIEGRTVGQLETSADWQAAVDQVVAQNAGTAGSPPEVDVELGHLDAAGVFRAGLPGDVPTAVRAWTSTTVGFAFAAGDGGATRSATATLQAQACFTVGSFLAKLRTNNASLLPVLSGLLGADLTVLGPSGVATLERASVPLADLTARLGVGGVEGLMDAEVSLGRLLNALAVSVVDQNGVADVAARAVFDSLAAQFSSRDLMVRIGDILDVGAGDGSALELGLNAFDFLAVALEAAAADPSGGHVYALNLGLGDLGVTGSPRLQLGIVEPARIQCGGVGSRATSTQLTIAASNIGINGRDETCRGINLIGICIDLRIVSVTAVLDIELEAAVASATLTDIVCTPEGVTTLSLSGVTEGAAIRSDVEAAVRVTLLTLPLARIVLNASVGRSEEEVEIVFPSDGLPGSVMIGGQPDDLLGSQLDLRVLGVSLGWVTAIVEPLLSGIINPVVNRIVLRTLFETLGVNLAGADVRATSRPSCGTPRLVG